MKMKSCLLLTGIGDYSITRNFYSPNIIDNHCAMIASVLKRAGISVCFIDARDNILNKDTLYSTISNLKPDSCIIRATDTNLNNIYNLHIEEHIPAVYTLSDSIIDNRAPQYKRLYWDCSKSDKDNLFYMLDLLMDNKGEYRKEIEHVLVSYEYWDFIHKTSPPYSVILKTRFNECGSSFAHGNIARKGTFVEDIVGEICHIVNNLKLQKFHVDLHGRTVDASQLIHFFKSLADNNFRDRTFTWSCSMSPEQLVQIIDNDKIVDFVKKSRLGQCFISYDHIRNAIADKPDIASYKSIFLDALKSLASAGIPSIVINYVIGARQESKETIGELIAYSSSISKAIPIVEFNVSYSSEGNESHIGFPSDTDFLTAQEMLVIKQHLHSLFASFMQDNIKRMSLQERLMQAQITSLGLNTQIVTYFLSRTPLISMYRNTINNRLLKFSFEINDRIQEYSPVFHPSVEYDDDNKPYVQVSGFLTNDGLYRTYLNKTEYILAEQTKRYKTIAEIINHVVSSEGISVDQATKLTLNFYSYLENMGLLNYTRLLKK